MSTRRAPARGDECTYWEYPAGGTPTPCPEPADRGSVYCKHHRLVVTEGITRRLAAMAAGREAV